MSEHAILSASGSHKWLHCTPSVRLEEQFENISTIFAKEGTAAHELSEHKLRAYLGLQTDRPVSEFDGKELEKYTDVYVDFAIELIEEAKVNCKDPVILLEQRLDFSNYVPNGFGTGDLIIVADGILDVVDLKYGKGVAVSATANPQMMLYALGAYSLFDSLYDIHTVRMTICQPRLESISIDELSIDELLGWAEEVLRPKAQLAYKGEGHFNPGEHCRFCRAKVGCAARAKKYLELAKYEFKHPSLLSDEELSHVMSVSEKLSTWVSDVFAYATECAINEGKVFDGFKLVAGKSNRKYVDEKQIMKICESEGITEIYKQSLLSVTALEKQLGKVKFQEVLGHLVHKPTGKPQLVSITDKRPALDLNMTAEAEFKGDF